MTLINNLTTTERIDSVQSTDSGRTRIVRVGLLAGVAAAMADVLLVAAARGAGASMDVGGEAIPLLAFAQLTLVGALIGIAIAAAVRRRSAHPRRPFIIITAALTAASLVPDVIVDATFATRVVLAATHVLAVLIIVPAIARRLRS